MYYEEINKAKKAYEDHFGEKAPPMGALMSLPGIFLEYIALLEDAVRNDKKIEWDKTIDWDHPDFDY